MPQQSLADLLRSLVEADETPLHVVARECGLPQATLYGFVRDGAGLSIDRAQKLIDHYKVKVVAPKAKKPSS